MSKHAVLALVLVASSSLAGCGSSDSKSPAGGPGAGGTSNAGDSGGGGGGGAGGLLTLTSSIFHEGELVPATSRCVAPSPDLAWSGGPTNAAGYAIEFQDVTPGISNGFLHWVLYDVAPDVHALDAGVAIGYSPPSPAGAHQAPIWNGTKGFNGPCGGQNTYELTLYAVDVLPLPGLNDGSTGPDTVTTITSHAADHVTMTVRSQP